VGMVADDSEPPFLVGLSGWSSHPWGITQTNFCRGGSDERADIDRRFLHQHSASCCSSSVQQCGENARSSAFPELAVTDPGIVG
jgi:hypothetical protein